MDRRGVAVAIRLQPGQPEFRKQTRRPVPPVHVAKEGARKKRSVNFVFVHGFVKSIESNMPVGAGAGWVFSGGGGGGTRERFQEQQQQTALAITAAATTTASAHFARYPHAEMAELYETTSGIIPYDGIS